MKLNLISVLISFFSFPCNHYVSSDFIIKQTIPVNTGVVVFDKYDLFRYKSLSKITKDKEVFLPQSFEIRLPKKMKYYSGNNGTDFCFYYGRGQVICVKTGFYKDDKNLTYEPTETELRDLIQHKLLTTRGKFDIKEIALKSGNKNLIIKRGKVMVLLYNIRNDNLNGYASLVNSFVII